MENVQNDSNFSEEVENADSETLAKCPSLRSMEFV